MFCLFTGAPDTRNRKGSVPSGVNPDGPPHPVPSTGLGHVSLSSQNHNPCRIDPDCPCVDRVWGGTT